MDPIVSDTLLAARTRASRGADKTRYRFASIFFGVCLLAAGCAPSNHPSTGTGGKLATKHPAPAKGVGKQAANSDDIGILLGDSVVRGFGRGPVYYNSRSPVFEPSAYRFVESADLPVTSLTGYQGINTWLNRGVTGNPSDAILARWNKDVTERIDRGAQTKRNHVRAILVSVGITDLGSAATSSGLKAAVTSLEKNMLRMVELAQEQKIRIAFLELPNPTRAPLGAPFHTLAGTPVKSFFEEHEYTGAERRRFTRAVQTIRKFMEIELRAAGGEVIDYASFLPKEYFWDSHHPSDPGYVELGRLLRQRNWASPVLDN